MERKTKTPNNMAGVGIAIGIAIGAAIGSVYSAKKNKPSEEDK